MSVGYWVIRTYLCPNGIGEKTKFYIKDGDASREKKHKPMSQRKADLNEADATKRLARTLNCNFVKGDYLLGLDLDDKGYRRIQKRAEKMQGEEKYRDMDPMDVLRFAAEHELRNYLRRVARGLGYGPRYIAVTSDMDGDTGEAVRLHFHLVIKREDLEIFRKKWTMGGVNWTPLSSQIDYRPIAEYLMRQVRRSVPHMKKYIISRNMAQPKVKEQIARSGAELRAPKGAMLLKRAEYSGLYTPQYIRYWIDPKKKEET